jgi:PHD/YefM family antitoxin component YafN of YafNO toxin-antitoxin module
MRRLTEPEVMATLPSLLQQLDQHSIVITRDGRDVGALISFNDYKLLQQITSPRHNQERISKAVEEI